MKMKKLFEGWRYFLNENINPGEVEIPPEWAGFHGIQGRPNMFSEKGRGGGLYQLGCLEDFYDEDLKMGTALEPRPDGKADTWMKEGDGGCPQFSHDDIIGQEDVDLAVRYLNDRRPINLVAYSRGGGVAYLAMKSANLKYRPNIYYVAPGWKKQGNLPAGAHSPGGFIIHGTADVRIPLRDSFELSLATNLPLSIFYNKGHLKDILDVGQNPQSGNKILSPESIKSLPWEQLPTWEGKIPFWEIPPDKERGIIGLKSSLVSNIEESQLNWCKTFL